MERVLLTCIASLLISLSAIEVFQIDLELPWSVAIEAVCYEWLSRSIGKCNGKYRPRSSIVTVSTRYCTHVSSITLHFLGGRQSYGESLNQPLVEARFIDAHILGISVQPTVHLGSRSCYPFQALSIQSEKTRTWIAGCGARLAREISSLNQWLCLDGLELPQWYCSHMVQLVWSIQRDHDGQIL